MSIASLQEECHRIATDHGWWEDTDVDDPNVVAGKLALIHSEVSEALEEVRKGRYFTYYETGMDGKSKPLGFGIELADTVIRILDLCGEMNIDLEDCIRTKIRFNKTRAHRHGGKKL